MKSHRIVKMMSWENNREKLKLIKIIIKIRQHLIITYLINYIYLLSHLFRRSDNQSLHSWESVYNKNLLNWMNSFCWWMMTVWKFCRHVRNWACYISRSPDCWFRCALSDGYIWSIHDGIHLNGWMMMMMMTTRI